MWRCIGKLKANELAHIKDPLFAVVAIVYFYIICTVNLYMTEDTILGMIPRVIASMCGVYLVCYSVMKSHNEGKLSHVIAYVGQNSLEVYFIHCVLVRSLTAQQIEVISTNGLITLTFGFCFILIATFGILAIIRKSAYLYRLIFGSRLRETCNDMRRNVNG